MTFSRQYCTETEDSRLARIEKTTVNKITQRFDQPLLSTYSYYPFLLFTSLLSLFTYTFFFYLTCLMASSNAKLFASYASELNSDLKKVNDRALRQKISFNPDSSKQAQEIIFSKKLIKKWHPHLVFNDINVSKANS